MANDSTGGVSVMDFSTIGELGKTYRDAALLANRQRTLAELAQSAGPLDYERAARSLFAGGDLQGGVSLARLAQQHYRAPVDFGTAPTPSASTTNRSAPMSAAPPPNASPPSGALGKVLTAGEAARGDEMLRTNPSVGRHMQGPLADWAKAVQDFETDLSPRNLALLGVASHRLSTMLQNLGVDVPSDALVRSALGRSATPAAGMQQPADQREG
jgi:hypothetical protein